MNCFFDCPHYNGMHVFGHLPTSAYHTNAHHESYWPLRCQTCFSWSHTRQCPPPVVGYQMKDNRELDCFHHHFTPYIPSSLLHDIKGSYGIEQKKWFFCMLTNLILILFTFICITWKFIQVLLMANMLGTICYIWQLYPRHALNLSTNSTLNNCKWSFILKCDSTQRNLAARESYHFLILPYDHFLGGGDKSLWEWKRLMKGHVPNEPKMALALLQPWISVVGKSIVVARSIGAFPLFRPCSNATEPLA